MDYSRRIFLATAAGAVAASAFPVKRDNRTLFPYGAHIFREPSLPLEQLKADMPLLKKLGFNMVKVQQSWATDEVAQDAVDMFKISQVIDAARENGLLVYLGVTMEQAPAWFWKKYPEARMVYENGQPVLDSSTYLLPSDGKPGPCWHHPRARLAAVKFLEATGHRARIEAVSVPPA